VAAPLIPSRDRTNARYSADPNYVWISGGWRTLEGAVKQRAAMKRANDRNNPRRVGTHDVDYLGMAPSAEHAEHLNQMARDFRASQKGQA